MKNSGDFCQKKTFLLAFLAKKVKIIVALFSPDCQFPLEIHYPKWSTTVSNHSFMAFCAPFWPCPEGILVPKKGQMGAKKGPKWSKCVKKNLDFSAANLRTATTTVCAYVKR